MTDIILRPDAHDSYLTSYFFTLTVYVHLRVNLSVLARRITLTCSFMTALIYIIKKDYCTDFLVIFEHLKGLVMVMTFP